MINIFKKQPEKVEPKETVMSSAEVTSADSYLYSEYALKPYNPSELYQKENGYGIYDKMRVDDQINSVLNLKKYIALNSDWFIDCEDEEVAEFLTLCLTTYMDEPIEKKLLDVLTAMDYGFSVTEKIPMYAETDFGGKYIFKTLKTRAPHSFEIITDKKGNIEKLTQDTATDGDVEIPLEKVILYSYKKEFDNHYGSSEMTKGVYTAWWSKQAIIKFWNIYLEKYASPLAVGTISKGSSKENRDAFKTIVNNLSARTGVTMPEGFTLDLLHGAEGKGEFEKAIDKYNMMIARALLVPDLMGLSGGETGGGSYSLGKEQFNMFYTVINNIRMDIKRLIDTELINPLLAWNYGTGVKAEFKFNPIDADRRQESLKMWLEAVKAGKIPDDISQLNWFLDAIEAPEVDPVEWQKEKDAKMQMAEDIKNAGKDNISDTDSDDDSDSESDDTNDDAPNEIKEKKKVKDDVDPEDKPVKEEFVAVEDVVKDESYWRPLTKYESKTDFKQIEQDDNELLDKFLPECGAVFKLIINAMLNDIKQKKIVERKRFDMINKLQVKHLAKLEKVFTAMSKESYDRGQKSVSQPDTSKFAFEQQAGVTAEQVAEWIKESAVYGAISESDVIQKKIKGVLFDSIRAGNGTRETAKQLDEALKGWDYLADAPKKLKSARLETIVRTNIGKAYGQARSDEFDKFQNIITGYFYSAILDNRTSDICISLDSGSAGIYEPAEKDLINPPNHYNCRSVLEAVYKWEEIDKVATLPDIEQTDGGFLKLKKSPKKAPIAKTQVVKKPVIIKAPIASPVASPVVPAGTNEAIKSLSKQYDVPYNKIEKLADDFRKTYPRRKLNIKTMEDILIKDAMKKYK